MAVLWPCPSTKRLPCIETVEIDFFKEEAERIFRMVNEMFYRETGSRYNGGCQTAVIRPCTPCQCECVCTCMPAKIDLCQAVDGPIQEVLCTKINGEIVENPRLLENRFLCMPEHGWPLQNLKLADSEECTWSVTVRYGETAPDLLLMLRDEYFWGKIKECLTGTKCLKPKTVSTKQGEFDLPDPLGEAKTAFGCWLDPSLYGLHDYSRPEVAYTNATYLVDDRGELWDCGCDFEVWCEKVLAQFKGVVEDCPEPRRDAFGMKI